MNELRRCFIRNFQFRKEYKLLSVGYVLSSRNATFPLAYNRMLIQFAGLGPKTQMEVPEEELADLLLLMPLPALKNHGADWKSRMVSWSSSKLTVKSVRGMTFSPASRGRKSFQKNRYLFNCWCPQKHGIEYLCSFSHQEIPAPPVRRNIWRAEGITEWKVEPTLFL